MVKQMKNLPSLSNDLYEVDKLAAARGHEVLRLPPYNCDLNVSSQNRLRNRCASKKRTGSLCKNLD